MFGLPVINHKIIGPAVHRGRCRIHYQGVLEEDVCLFGQEGKDLWEDTEEFMSRQLLDPAAAPCSRPVSDG